MGWPTLISAVIRDTDPASTPISAKTLKEHTKNGSTPLHFACVEEDTRWVEMLIKRGACVNAQNCYGESPLHWAALHYVDHVVCLLSYQAKPTIRDNDGKLPIHFAAESGDVEIVRALLQENESDLLVEDFAGQTPLHTAISFGNVDIIKMYSVYITGEMFCFAVGCGEVEIVQYLLNSNFYPTTILDKAIPLALSLEMKELLYSSRTKAKTQCSLISERLARFSCLMAC